MKATGMIRVSTCLGALFMLTQCTSSPSSDGTGGTSGGSTGGSSATGGNNNTGGNNTGGNNATGGNSSTGGSASGGSTGSGGSSASGGSTGSGGSGMAGASGNVDQGGQALAKKGDSTSTSKAYLNLGDMRLLNNRWGSDSLSNCSSMQTVMVNTDGSLGWTFNRGGCNEQNHSSPDFPEVEFGVAPFGTGSSLLTSPPFSSTTLLPIQLSALKSASVTLDTFSTTFSKPTYWDANIEFWISKNDPTKNADGGVYAEIITFVGWNSNRQDPNNGGWQCQISNKTVPNTNFSLCHQSDSWASGWHFYNFLAGSSSSSNWTGKFDVKAVLDYVRSQYSGFTDSMYLTRIEIGTEIDDNTAGSAKVGSGVTFEINGTSKKIQLAQ
jgi:Glycosyl hydrolase family 12